MSYAPSGSNSRRRRRRRLVIDKVKIGCGVYYLIVETRPTSNMLLIRKTIVSNLPLEISNFLNLLIFLNIT
jgi:hypothetical protein